MSSQADIRLGESGDDPQASPPRQPGTVLAEARQKLGLSVGDIAAKLRMSVVQIDAMERGDYGKLPKGTFLRGFARSYAKLVGLNPEDLLRLLEETHAESRKPAIVVPTQNIRMSSPGERYSNPQVRLLLALLLVLSLSVGGAYWWFQVRPGQVEPLGRSPVKAMPDSTAPVPAKASAPAEAAALELSPSPAAQVVAPPIAATVQSAPSASVVAAESPPAPQPQVAPLTQTTAPLASARPSSATETVKVAVPKGSGSLQFTFTGESWVEVVDATGRTVVSRRFQAGQSESVVGKLPVSVVIGNATVTKLQFNQVDFDLTPHTRVAVARFTLK